MLGGSSPLTPAGPSPHQPPHYPFPSRLKPIQKMEGVANGVAVGQQSTGLADISAQVQQYQQFLGESQWAGQPACCLRGPRRATGSLVDIQACFPLSLWDCSIPRNLSKISQPRCFWGEGWAV